MSCDHISECEDCSTEIRSLELDLLAERDMRIGGMARLGNAEWRVPKLTSEMETLEEQLQISEQTLELTVNSRAFQAP
jgi:hypothetical protein